MTLMPLPGACPNSSNRPTREPALIQGGDTVEERSGMGFIGGDPAYRFLKRFYPGGQNVPMSQGNPYKERGESKLAVLFGPEVFSWLKGKLVLDFGCGDGENSIELAERGAAKVIGLDIQEAGLKRAREQAELRGVAGRCEFVTSTDQKADVVLSTDAFEHFEDPGAVLRAIAHLLHPDGFALIEFGPTWFHPYGGHLFSVFPWAHLVFTEKALMRWRSDFKTDGATRFHEVAGGLNQMTIRRWERLVCESPLRFLNYELVPIRKVKPWHNRWTREIFTSIIRAKLGLKNGLR